MRNRAHIFFYMTVFLLSIVSCTKESIHGDGFHHYSGSRREPSQRVENVESRNVLLLYSAACNSISSYLEEDVRDIQQGWIPESGRNTNVLLVYSHFPAKKYDYTTPSSPTLTRIQREPDGTILKDTLIVYPTDTRSATKEQLNKVLTYVQEKFPANSYGMIFSSHATGYLPAGYYSAPGDYIFTQKQDMRYRNGAWMGQSTAVPYHEPLHDPSMPAVKSIGQDVVGPNGNRISYEIELADFANAIPMHLEYIMFDACLMGGVEVAYELKDKCRYLGFSQAEVLAEGFDYKTLVSHLLGSDTPDPQAVCEDYFHQYDVQTGVYRSATISLVDCSKMESLAVTCRSLFERYREQIAVLKPGSVQRYYRSDYHWFYDLADIIAKSGASAEEMASLNDALNECIVYKASTPSFMGSFDINIFSGFSMYLPSNGSKELDKFYKTLQWNKATGLVR